MYKVYFKNKIKDAKLDIIISKKKEDICILLILA
jgi:hypothetical protein